MGVQGNAGIMEGKMETTTWGLGFKFRVSSLGFRIWGLGYRHRSLGKNMHIPPVYNILSASQGGLIVLSVLHLWIDINWLNFVGRRVSNWTLYRL